jgi:predicted  nucleic acid-binding Zn-ribbon protein
VLRFAQLSALALAFAMVTACLAAQEYHTTEQWRAKFDHEADPVRKAKLLLPLGEAEFKDAEGALTNDKATEALDILKKYLDEAQSCEKALEEKFPDAEKHANGYKQLQISLRGSLRRLDAMIVGLNEDDRKPFVEIRGQLDEIDRHLIHMLFPKQPANDGAGKPKR